MKKNLIVLVIISLSFLMVGRYYAQNPALDAEKEALKKAVVNAYIEGVFLRGNAAMIKKGMHPDCDVLILRQGNLIKINAHTYADKFAENPGPLHAGTTYEFTYVHVTGYAGFAIVEIFQNGKHIYTDYLNLYKFADGWKLVTKTYYTHPKD